MKIVTRKKSQVTIFIIIAVVLVAAVAFFFLLFYKTKPEISAPSMENPEQYIEKCAKDAAIEAIDIMLPQGGWINPVNYKMYDGNKIQYLCYTNLFYVPCKNQEPMFIEHLEKEITDYITPKIEYCFQNLKSGLEKENYKIEIGGMELRAELIAGTARIRIERKFAMSKQEESRRFDSFISAFNSPLYNLAVIAMDISNQEARYCNFEYLGYMMIYPEFSIDRKNTGGGNSAGKIYIIQDRNTGKKLNIAVRGCQIPAGI